MFSIWTAILALSLVPWNTWSGRTALGTVWATWIYTRASNQNLISRASAEVFSFTHDWSGSRVFGPASIGPIAFVIRLYKHKCVLKSQRFPFVPHIEQLGDTSFPVVIYLQRARPSVIGIMLRYSIIYGFSLVVGFVAAQTEYDTCQLTCDGRALSASGCLSQCVYFHPSVGRPPLLVDIVLLFRPY